MAKEQQTKEEVIKDLEIQKAQLEIDNLKAQSEYFKDAREEATERREKTRLDLAIMRMKQDQIKSVQRDRAKQLSDQEMRDRARVLICPHKKGGMDLAGYHAGDDSKYAVFRHQWPNGDYSIHCQRCPNIVIPPVEPMRVALTDGDLETIALYGHKTPIGAGFFEKEDAKGYMDAKKLYVKSYQEYTFWLKMQTNNEASGSNQLKQISSSSSIFTFDRMYRLALHDSMNIPIFQAQKWPPAKGEIERLTAAA